ncbi:MAG: hypothetical protein FWH52_00210 [Synergistaceae bacterium]|nr:hypothetical protein [Synergistaceae bacterium]
MKSLRLVEFARESAHEPTHEPDHEPHHESVHAFARESAHEPTHEPDHEFVHESAHESVHESAHEPTHESTHEFVNEFANEQNFIDLFLSLPKELYANDKNYRSEDTKEVINWLKRDHPCREFLFQKNLLVLEDEKILARGIAFVNKLGNFGAIGFFECKNNAVALQILVDSAKEFCRANDISKIYAPMNGSIWNEYRLMTKGFGDYPFMGEPYNKVYYRDVLEKCGFKVVKTWESQFVDKISVKDKTAVKFLNLEKDQHSKGIKVRSMKKFDEDIKIIHKIVMNSFTNFFAFHEIDEEVFCNIYKDLKLICDKRTLKIAFNRQNEPIGFGLALPDYKNKTGFLLRYAKRYIFLYLGAWQENGESAYPHVGKAIVTPIMKNLYIRRKNYICAMLGEDVKTRKFAPAYEKVHEYALMELEV